MQQLTLGLEIPEASWSEDFLVTAVNQEAYTRLMQWPHWGQYATTSLGVSLDRPLDRIFWVSGEKGAGKTHLCRLFARHLGAQPFTWLNAKAIAQPDVAGMLRPHHVYILDDIESIAIEDTFLLHLLNWMGELPAWLVITSSASPHRTRTPLPDLSSRLKALPTAHIQAPDSAFLELLLMKLLVHRQLRCHAEVIPFILKRIDRSARAIIDFVQRLDHESLVHHRNLTLPFIRTILPSSGEET